MRSVGVSPRNVSASNGSSHGGGKLKTVERRVKIGELVLRCVVFGLGAVATVLVATDSQVREIFSVRKKARFTDMKALVFLVIANGIAAGYSLVQGLRCVVSMFKGCALFSKPLAWAIFSFDQVMAYLTLAAVAAATESAVLGQSGQPQFQWMKICNLYGKFCTRVGEGLVSAVIASLCMVALASVSAFNLFRLYNTKNNKMGGGYW